MCRLPALPGRLVLASKSPRRAEILRDQLGVTDFTAMGSAFEESLDKSELSILEYALETSRHKAIDVYRTLMDGDEPPAVVLAADTVVICQNKILEKPRDIGHHIQMLQMLRSAKKHRVFTGLTCIVPLEEPVFPGYAMETHLEESEVKVHGLTDELIYKYFESGEARDAAGGYMIQGQGGNFVKLVKGDFYNVVGLPVDATVALVKKTLDSAWQDLDWE